MHTLSDLPVARGLRVASATVETLQMRKRLLTLSLAKPTQKSEAVLNTHDFLFMESHILLVIYFVKAH
jgi:hypothetical protein